MSEALRKALKVIDKHSVSAIRTNSKDRGDWAEDMAYVGKVAREALAQPPAPTAQPAPMSQPNRLIAYSAAAKLREIGYVWDEKSGKWEAAQPVQQPGAEPIGWQYRWTNPGGDPIVHQQDIDWKPVASRAPAQTIQQRIDELRGYKYTDGKPFYEVRAIYTQAAPAQRQPLTQDEILDMAEGASLQFHDLLEFARAIEAAHGITAAPAAQKGEKL